jgi:hypothetical protein
VRPAARSPSPARRERGTKGVRAIQRACPFTLALGKTAPAAEIPCQAVVPLSALSRGERVGVRGDSSPVHPRTLAAQLVIVHLQLELFLLPFQWRQGLRRSCLGVRTAPLANRSYRASVAVAYSRVTGFTFLGCGFPLPRCQNGLRATTTVASARPYPNSRPSEENWIENAPNISWL